MPSGNRRAAVERSACRAEERERQGPPLAEESEICKLLGAPPYDELDHTSPWCAIRALGFPPAGRPRIITEATYDPITGQRKVLPPRLGPVMWERERVRQWLQRFDAVTAAIQRPEKRHRYFR